MVKKCFTAEKTDFLTKLKFASETKFKGVNDVSLSSNWYLLFNFVSVTDIVMFQNTARIWFCDILNNDIPAYFAKNEDEECRWLESDNNIIDR